MACLFRPSARSRVTSGRSARLGGRAHSSPALAAALSWRVAGLGRAAPTRSGKWGWRLIYWSRLILSSRVEFKVRRVARVSTATAAAAAEKERAVKSAVSYLPTQVNSGCELRVARHTSEVCFNLARARLAGSALERPRSGALGAALTNDWRNLFLFLFRFLARARPSSLDLFAAPPAGAEKERRA